MYGKTLKDFPDRFQAFEEVLAKESPEDIDQGFRDCMKTSREFPVPADVLAATHAAAATRRRIEQERLQFEERRKDDAIKNQRFLTDGGTQDLEQEFREMLQRHGIRQR